MSQTNIAVDEQTYTVDDYRSGQSATFRVYQEDLISDVIRTGQKWEPHLHEVFSRYLDSTSVVLEAGCHIGTHSVYLSKSCSRLICFEPFGPSHALLKQNLADNNCDNVVLFEMGLSDVKGSADIDWVFPGNIGSTGFAMSPSAGSINLITVDSLHLERLDFMKLDVEGYESKIIEGAIQTILRHKPVIALECWDKFPSYSEKTTRERFAFLLANGYALSHIEGPDWLFVHESRDK